MVEMLARERAEKLTAWELSITAQGLFTMGETKAVAGVVEVLREEYKRYLFHDAYTAQSVFDKLYRKLNQVKERVGHMSQLDKLSSFDKP